MSVIGGQNPIVQDGLVYILDFGNERSYTSGSNSAQSLIYNPVTASFTAPPAGDYSGLAAAYSVRRVVSSYSGPAMEVRSGSVSASIGFDSLGNLDTASLEAFAGSGDAFVKTWYDQSGNGYNAVQATAANQPQIVSAGSTITENGKPAVDFDGSNHFLNLNLTQAKALTNSAYKAVAIVSSDNGITGARNRPLFIGLNTSTRITFINENATTFEGSFNTYVNRVSISFNTQQQYLAFGEDLNGTQAFYLNSTTSGTNNLGGTTNDANVAEISNATNTQYLNGTIQEIVMYNSDQSSNRILIENNINNYYSIYSPSSSLPPTPPDNTLDLLEFSNTALLNTNQSFPNFSYNQGNLTLIFTGQTSADTALFLQEGGIGVSYNTSSVGYGSPNGNLGREFPTTGFNHVSLRFTTGSVDCFINGIPTAPNNINTKTTYGGDSKFKIKNNSGSLGNLLVYNRELTDDEIYDTYLQQARRYGLPETAKPYSVDSSVYTYTQAAGITGSSVITALDAFVSGLKANNLWNKMIAIYPFLGSDTIKTRYNLKDPSLNTTAITYSGSWLSSDSGSYNNNTSSYGILENIKGDYYHPLISSESIHLSYLSYDTPASGGYLMGTEELPGLPGDIATPAAAYSVRKVRTAYTGSAMDIRRDFDDVEFTVGFDGSGNLDTGSLLRNMTASLNTPTLPGDYSGLAAAYSLRKVSSSYSGYAVEVRRAVDNYSASIGFDGSGNLNTASLASFIRTGSETPLDAYSGLAAAYSLRKVVPSYAGDAIEIRSGSVSQSIGFDSFGDLDVAAIKSFAGSGDAFVKTWYDQSGNGLHATQSVAASQPKIYSGSQGSVIYDNGKPAINFTATSTFSLVGKTILTTLATASTFVTFTDLGSGNTSNGLLVLGWSSPSPANRWYQPYVTGTSAYLSYAGALTTINLGTRLSTQQITSLIADPASSLASGYQNGVLKGSTAVQNIVPDTANNAIGKEWIGNAQEILIYSSSQAANRTYIENNINSYYGIYTPDSISTEDAYVKTWYDQSGNGYHATQSVDASQPQIVSNGVIITSSLSKPALSYRNSTAALTSAITGLSSFTNMSVFAVNQPVSASAADITTQTLFGIEKGGANRTTDPGLSVGGATGLLSGETYGMYFTSPSVDAGRLGSSTYVHNANQVLIHSVYTLNSGFLAYKNGEKIDINLSRTINTNSDVSPSSTSILSNTFHIGSLQGTTSADQLFQELLVYSTPQTSSRGLIEDNINGYYNIFTHTLESGSGYVSKWYDQSGNDNHAIQTTLSKQPPVVSSGSVLLENSKPAIHFTTSTVNSMGFSAGDITTVNSNYSFSIVKTPKGGTNPWLLIGGTYYNQHISSRIAVDLNYILPASPFFGTQMLSETYFSTNTQYYENNTLLGSGYSYTPKILTDLLIGFATYQQYSGSLQEIIIFTGSLLSSRGPISQDINSYFNIYTPPGYNLNTNSLSLFSSPTTVAGAANAVASGLTTGGPLGLITVSRTGSSNYTLWKNRVPNKVTLGASTPLSNEIYLNAANLDNSLFSGSQNNISFASVGAGLTDDDVYTYYELVDDLQTSLNRGVQDPGAFISTWDTRITASGTSDSSTIQFPVALAGTASIDWGDGTISLVSSSAQPDITHSYATPGIYTISLTGGHQKINFFSKGNADKRKILDISQWGSGSWLNDIGAFWNGVINLRPTANDAAVGGSTLRLMFAGIPGNPGVEKWDVSNTSNFNAMFSGVSNFNRDLGNWDMRSATNISQLFYISGFNNFNRPTINNWRFNTSSAVSINGSDMFYSSPFNQPVGDWNVDSFTNMSRIFYTATKFNQDLSNWNVSRVTSFERAFGTTPFNNSGSAGINNWNTISCSNMSAMFSINSAFNQPIGNWNTSNVTDMGGMFWQATVFNQPIGSWNTSKVTDFTYSGKGMFEYAYAFNQNIGSWDVSKVVGTGTTGFYRMFYAATAFNNSGSSDINNWRFNTSSTLTFAGMFGGDNTTNSCKFNQNIGSWNVEKVISMNNMFQNNTAFNNSGSSDINNWRPISCSDFSSMFSSATAFNQPIGNWTIGTGSHIPSTGINMSYMFYDADSFNQNIGAWNIEKVTNMSNMFYGTRDFNNSGSSDINNWRPISCSNFNNMFRSATAFNQPIGNWPLSASNTTLSGMFISATAFNQDISSWDTSNVTNMYAMFLGATSFNQNIGSWDVSNVVQANIGDLSVYTSFRSMFQNATSFNNGGSSDINNWRFNTSSIYNLMEMFAGASSFNQPLGDWNIVSCSNMSSMLNGSGIDIPNYTKTLRGWGDLANSTGVQTAVPLGASGKKYGAAHAQRKVLTDTYGWTITDGGQEPFVFTINTTASGYNPGTELTFQLPILDANTGSYALDILVDWGDSSTSTISSSTQPEITHTYSNSGSYEITITGSLTGFNFNNGGDKAKLTDVSKWSALEINTGVGNFHGCSNLIGSATDAPFISSAGLGSCFQSCTNFNGAIGSWDVSNVTSTAYMFFVSPAFNQPIGDWTVSSVNDMQSMFRGALAFDQPIGSWDTSLVTNMSDMFRGAIAFNQDISNWNVSKVINFQRFMRDKSTEYDPNYMDSIFNNWPNYKLQPNLSVDFGSINYTAAGVEGKALLERPYTTIAITGIQNNGGDFQITANSHGLSTGNRLTISGSNYTPLNKAHAITVVDSNNFTVPVAFTGSALVQGEVITGYGWTMITGSQI